MNLILILLQQMSVFLVIAYVFSKSPAFYALAGRKQQFQHKIIVYVTFTTFSILGTYFGLPIKDAIANTRAIGAVLGGIFGGPWLGLAIGFTSGLHRYTLGGFTDLACGVSTTVDGLIGGVVHLYILRNGGRDQLFNPLAAFVAALSTEVIQMILILTIAKPFHEALELVKVIAAPMILANAAGSALFMSILRDKKNMVDRFQAIFSGQALKLVEKITGPLVNGFNQETAKEISTIIQEETGVGAVAITDHNTILAFVGMGNDHHVPGGVIESELTKQAINENRVIYADGIDVPYSCGVSRTCPLGSVLVIPLRAGKEVIGTIKLYEPKKKLFLTLNKTLGEGIANLLSNQLLLIRFEEQKNLLTRSELQLIHAQINPHFLFNALNTIIATTRKNNTLARDLLLNLSNFFRKNLKRSQEFSTIAEEMDHVKSYLEIEKARFAERLIVEEHVDPNCLSFKIPSFTLQPIIENAIKHGTSNILEPGVIKLTIQQTDNRIVIEVEDNAGAYQFNGKETGLGMNIVDKRIKNKFGESFGIKIQCEPDLFTKVMITFPLEGQLNQEW
ncbi:sensor histidine kinase [bacterium]|nr:sensor histidine kinase [bacterium]